jgi:NADH:ubiquinone oxidoreductase subunit 6 (subunit J)
MLTFDKTRNQAMENISTPTRVSGAFLILAFSSFVGILSSIVYSGYAAFAIGFIVVALLFGTRYPEAKRDRMIVFSLAAISMLLGVGAIALGVLVRTLTHILRV